MRGRHEVKLQIMEKKRKKPRTNLLRKERE
jgi:hypothetical protein